MFNTDVILWQCYLAMNERMLTAEVKVSKGVVKLNTVEHSYPCSFCSELDLTWKVTHQLVRFVSCLKLCSALNYLFCETNLVHCRINVVQYTVRPYHH